MRRSPERWRAIEMRLGRESTAWVSTVRPDNSPHLLPVWFVWLDNIFYFVVPTHSEQYENLKLNQRVSISLPDPERVIMIEGEAHASSRTASEKLSEYFFNKYEFDFTRDPEIEWRLVEVTPSRLLAWGDGYDHEGVQVL